MKSSPRALLFNTIASLSLAGFFMYSVQELALSRMEGRMVNMVDIVMNIIVYNLDAFRVQSYQPPILSSFTIIQADTEDDSNEVEEDTEQEKTAEEVRLSGREKVWITMGGLYYTMTTLLTYLHMQGCVGVRMLRFMGRKSSHTQRQLCALPSCGTR